jgi:thymidylate kinase
MSIPKRDSRTPSVPGRALSFLDYLLAQLYVQLRYVMRGYVVIYDHYFDLVSNGKSKVTLPAVFTSWWYRFLLKPDLNFLLYAPVDVIRQRKQELSPEDIEKITGQYLALFDKLERKSGQGHYISVRNMRLGDTLETLFHHIKSHQVGAAA